MRQVTRAQLNALKRYKFVAPHDVTSGVYDLAAVTPRAREDENPFRVVDLDTRVLVRFTGKKGIAPQRIENPYHSLLAIETGERFISAQLQIDGIWGRDCLWRYFDFGLAATVILAEKRNRRTITYCCLVTNPVDRVFFEQVAAAHI